MDKRAPVDHPVEELIRARWSPRAFADRDVDEQDLRTLFEAARWAPSAFNDQPWRFLVATRAEEDDFRWVLGCLGKWNQKWAGRAPVLGIAVSRTTFTRNGNPSRTALYDTGQAMAVLTVQATAMGLSVHQMSGFSQEAAREAFGLPGDVEPVAAFAIGYLGDAAELDEEFEEQEHKPRERLALEELVFTGRWGEARPRIGEKAEVTG